VYRGDLFLQSSILPFIKTKGLSSYVLSPGDAVRLSATLRLDATDCFYSAAISISDALAGIERRFFSWATVKLYYSTFYAIQAMLACDGYCLFHVRRSPKWIQAQSGSRPTKAGGSTHESTLDYFAKNYSAHLLLSQPIDGVPSLRWLMEKRVQANYSNTGFCEPVVPKHLSSVSSNGIRQAVQAYISDDSSIYLFDPDHAMLAFPLRCITFARERLVARGCPVLEDDRSQFLMTTFRDRHGPLQGLQAVVK